MINKILFQIQADEAEELAKLETFKLGCAKDHDVTADELEVLHKDFTSDKENVKVI